MWENLSHIGLQMCITLGANDKNIVTAYEPGEGFKLVSKNVIFNSIKNSLQVKNLQNNYQHPQVCLSKQVTWKQVARC